LLIFDSQWNQIAAHDVDSPREAHALLQAAANFGGIYGLWATPEPTCLREECNAVLSLVPDGILFHCQLGETLQEMTDPAIGVCLLCSEAFRVDLISGGTLVIPMKDGRLVH
jgi:hypothetical protein